MDVKRLENARVENFSTGTRGSLGFVLLGEPFHRADGVHDLGGLRLALLLELLHAPASSLVARSSFPAHAQTPPRRGVLSQLRGQALVRTDSPAQGAGFEPSVPLIRPVPEWLKKAPEGGLIWFAQLDRQKRFLR